MKLLAIMINGMIITAIVVGAVSGLLLVIQGGWYIVLGIPVLLIAALVFYALYGSSIE